jgi:hypothetical protein
MRTASSKSCENSSLIAPALNCGGGLIGAPFAPYARRAEADNAAACFIKRRRFISVLQPKRVFRGELQDSWSRITQNFPERPVLQIVVEIAEVRMVQPAVHPGTVGLTLSICGSGKHDHLRRLEPVQGQVHNPCLMDTCDAAVVSIFTIIASAVT